ncbi:MAG: aminopeptidase, partial [Bacilli bacterium]|nr:aminopeptidase [Bacilli bacterium]
PDRLSINGVVYNSKPLSYQDNIIDNFHITFENGKVTGFEAETGYDTLKELLSSTPNIDYLGEVAIVEKTSSINKTGLIFYETLFDENAACHIALGDSFPECFENGNNMSKDELYNLGLNNCLNHVDFMIGTDDLNITGITSDNKEYKVLEEGIFVLK